MKIELEIPDWVMKDKPALILLSNQELIAIKEYGEEWKVKKSRCVQCGECCMQVEDGLTPFGSNDEMKCNALKKEGDKWICTAGANKPYHCLRDPSKEEYPDCAIRYF